MEKDRVESRTGRCKLIILVSGILVLGVGLYSYLESAWKKNNFHTHCSTYLANQNISKCPGISMEKYFAGIIVLTYMLSILNVVASLLIGYRSFLTKTVDIGFHVVAAVLILIGAIVLLVSAEQINHIYKYYNPKVDGEPAKMLRGGKLAAGILTVVQSLLYAVTAFFIWSE